MKIKIIVPAIIVSICILAIFAFSFFSTHFLPWVNINTELFTEDIGMLSVDDVQDKLCEKIQEISFRIKDEKNDIEIPLTDVYDINMEKITEKLNKKFTTEDIDVKITDVIDLKETSVEGYLTDALSKTTKEVSQNAYIDFVDGQYVIVEEKYGNEIKEDTVEKIANEIKNFSLTINIDELNGYKKPQITKDDANLIKKLNKLKEYEDVVISFQLNGKTEVIDIQKFNNWFELNYVDEEKTLINEQEPIIIYYEKIEEYVNELNTKEYDIADIFTTSTNIDILYSTSTNGKWVYKTQLVRTIAEKIINKTSEEIEIPLKETPDIINKTSQKIGNTYIEVSIEEQHIWMYIDGELVIDSDIVTGNLKRNYNTRKGIFNLTYKTRNATLRGPGYASFVNYWMPFDGGIGLHDALWRDEFGGDIYKTDGSHGCVNLPLKTAKTIYENITNDMPIIVW